MANKNNVPIQETFELPSRGKLYGEEAGVPSSVTLRAMTALDEKLRLSSNNPFIATPKLIDSCIVDEHKRYSAADLKFFDLHFLVYKLRTITYGSEYKIKVYCGQCGNTHDVTINLDEIPVNYIEDENLVEPIAIGPLPVSGDTIGVKLMTANDYLFISNEGKKIKTKFPDYEGDPEFIPSYQAKILTINGKAIEMPIEVQKYVESMHARDMLYFDNEYNKISDNLGLDLDTVSVCPTCGNEIKYTIPMTEEFFRPEY